ncbi:hypothetical protein [Streptomyces sp. NPDC058877]|uniref:hypothetical protein n=1 Tax=unclassified Streptomyces TaxID=2593676 RepID=UPI0036C40356
MDNIERTIRTGEAVDAVIKHHPSKAVRLMEEIIAFSSTDEVYRVCRLLAEMGLQNLLQIHVPTPGQMWAMKEPAPHGQCHPAHVFSARFITAHANDDDEQCKVLFDILLTKPQQEFASGIMALLTDVGNLTRRVLEAHPSA